MDREKKQSWIGRRNKVGSGEETKLDREKEQSWIGRRNKVGSGEETK